MRKLYVFILMFAIIAPMVVTAQPGKVIVDTNKIWSIVEENCHPWGNTYSTFYMKFAGDTVVDSKSYRKVFVSNLEDHSEWEEFGGMIRENDEKQVFYRASYTDEGMIYDFNIELYDTIEIVNPRLMMEPISLYVSALDSVEIADGFLEKWTLDGINYSGQDTWYEEIGSIASVLNSTYPLFGQSCGAWEFLCLMEDEELVYSNPNYETCYYELVGVREQAENQSIEISPNPATDFIRINNSTQSHYKTILLRDLSGKLIQEFNNVNEAGVISLPQLQAGIYILMIQTEQANLISRKLMIK